MATADQLNTPLSIDIDFLLERVRDHRKELYGRKDDGKALDEYFQKIKPKLEPFLDLIMLIKNQRASKQASERAKSGEAANVSSFYIFDDANDFCAYLKQLLQDNPKNSFSFEALVPHEGKGHSNYIDVVIREGKVSLVAFESNHQAFSETTAEQLIDAEAWAPGVMHNATIITTNMQKQNSACHMFNINVGAKNLRPEMRAQINALHEENLANDQQPIKILLDSYGESLHPFVYLHAQSETQTKGIIQRPTHVDLKLSEAILPKRKKRNTLLQHSQNNRVIQESFNLAKRAWGTYPFNYSINSKRIKELDRVIDHLEDLKKLHGEKAGTVLAQELSSVWGSRQPDWDRFIPETRALCEKNGTAWIMHRSFWDADHPCWSADKSGQMGVILETLRAMPNWSRSPGIRIAALSRVDEKLSEILKDDLTLRNTARSFIEPITDALVQGAPHVNQDIELRRYLRLHQQTLALQPIEEKEIWLKKLVDIIPKLKDGSLQIKLAAYITGKVAELASANFEAETTHSLIADTVVHALASDVNDRKSSLAKVRELFKLRDNFPAGSKSGEVYDAAVELAHNCSFDELQQLVSKRAQSNNGEMLDLRDDVKTLQSKHQGDWKTFDNKEEVLHINQTAVNKSGNRWDKKDFQVIDLDNKSFGICARVADFKKDIKKFKANPNLLSGSSPKTIIHKTLKLLSIQNDSKKVGGLFHVEIQNLKTLYGLPASSNAIDATLRTTPDKFELSPSMMVYGKRANGDWLLSIPGRSGMVKVRYLSADKAQQVLDAGHKLEIGMSAPRFTIGQTKANKHSL